MDKVLIRFSDERGKIHETVFETESLENLRNDLNERGYFILSETYLEKTLSQKLSSLLPFFKAVSMTELIEFSQLLRTLLKAGLPLKDSLDVLLDEGEKGPLQRAIGQIKEDIVEGLSFSKALSRHPQIFPEMYVKTIIAGEKSGALDEVLSRLISYYKNRHAIKRKLVAAIIYPALLLLVSIVSITYLIVKVVPEFSELFRSLDVPLPIYTQIVLGISTFLGSWFVPILFLFVAVFVLLSRYYRTMSGRVIIDGFKLRIPIIGKLESKNAFSQFSRTLSTLLAGGIPILESLDIVVQSLDNKEIANRLNDLAGDIQKGTPFARGLKSIEEIPPTMIKIVHVGEESGNMEGMLNGIADHYDEEISALTSTMTTLIEPILFLFIAATVGSVIIALLIPVLTAASNIN